MKTLRYSLLLVLLFSFYSCDFLNYSETNKLNKRYVFSSFDRNKRFVNSIYNHMPGGFSSVGGAMLASGTDDAEEINDNSAVQKFNDGSWSPTNLADNEWGRLYDGIRAANLYLKEGTGHTSEEDQFNKNYEQQMEQYRLYPYEVRFLRAYFYFELIKRYGQVPLITEVLAPSEANKVTSSSFQEVVNFIVEECDTIAPKLPDSYKSIPRKETGRATMGSAMALKARTLLYAASPLHNSKGDQQKWIQAAKAAKAVLDLTNYSLDNNYSNIFNNISSSELIWGRRHGQSNSFERANFPVGYEGANPGTAPTQNLVDAYEMQKSGKGINQPGSGYNPKHPYEGRDPRLKKTIIVNNAQWKNRNVQIWNGGKDGPPQDNATETGYYLKKYVIKRISLEPSHTTTAHHTWVIFRYGGILLDYAEAMNEAYGPEDPAGMGMTARQGVNKIRERANMPPFPVGLSQDEFRQKLRNERRVELAFEGNRFWDIRRWKIGPSTTDIKGITITKNADGSFTYHKKTVEQRVWNKKMYLYPIPQSEIYKNDNLKQNPRW